MMTVLENKKSTPTTPQGGAGGERSELLYRHGRKQTHPTTGEEEDLPYLSNMQVLLPQSDSHVPECWQLWDIISTPYHWVEGGGGAGQHCTIYREYMRISYPNDGEANGTCLMKRVGCRVATAKFRVYCLDFYMMCSGSFYFSKGEKKRQGLHADTSGFRSGLWRD